MKLKDMTVLALLCVPAMAVTLCVQPDLRGPNVTCNSLEYYVENQAEYFTSNTNVEFLPGTHKLSGVLNVSGVRNLTLYCNGPPSKADILCDEYSGLIFGRSFNITIHNIRLISCGADASQLTGTRVFAALLFQEVSVITLDSVSVTNSSGYGMYAVQTCGQTLLQRCSFHSSIRGNTKLLFKECSADTRASLLMKSSELFNGSAGYSTAPGGLLVHSLFPGLVVHLDNVTASSNNGGNIRLMMEAHHWKISINNSRIMRGNGVKGVGLYFLCKHPNTAHQDSGNSMTIMDTVFAYNKAREQGGGLTVEYYDTDTPGDITLLNCTFHGNEVTTSNGRGAALTLFTNPSLRTCRMNVYIVGSYFHNNSVTGTGPAASVTEFVNIKMANLTDTTFSGNNGTAVVLSSSDVVLAGDTQFDGNRATYGGALRLCDSCTMFVSSKTRVILRNNHAYKMGGAIYAQDNYMYLDQPTACFFQLAVKDNSLITDLLSIYHINVTFADNTAGVAGDAIYGGDIYNCYTYTKFRNSSGKLIFPLKYLTWHLVAILWDKFRHASPRSAFVGHQIP
jgi:hypothetical protein